MASADFNVRDFGAKGDGVTDDTLAIQNAVTKACNEGQLLIFPQAEAGKYYKISNQIVIPWNTHDWAIRGAPHRARILQVGNNLPFLHFDSFKNDTPGLTNGSFDVSNFSVTWETNQPVSNTHSAILEFNDGGYADAVLENLENVNGCRCITHQFPGDTAGRRLNLWGVIIRHLYNAYAASGAAIYLRNTVTEGLPNILIQHVYSVQAHAGEELIHLAGAGAITIDCVEQNFGSFTPGLRAWAGSGNITISNWRCEEYTWSDNGSENAYFVFHGSGDQITEYHISNFEMRFCTVNLANDKFLIKANGSRVRLNGLLDPGTRQHAGYINLIDMVAPNSIAEVGISAVLSDHVRFCRPGGTHLGNIEFTGGTRTLEFYKDNLAPNMTAAINDAPSAIKGQLIVQGGWLWSVAILLDAEITAGSVKATIFKNGVAVDASVELSSGRSAQYFNAWLKNQHHADHHIKAGDIIDVRMTTGANLLGPHNAQISAVIANI